MAAAAVWLTGAQLFIDLANSGYRFHGYSGGILIDRTLGQ